MKRKPFSRREKWVLGASVPALLLLGSFGWLLTHARVSGAIPPHAPMPKPNGFDLYVAAARALVKFDPSVDAVNDTKARSPQEIARFYTPARRAAYVRANARAWNLMQQARAARTQHPDLRANILARLPYGPQRDLARAKTIEAKHFRDLNRWDLALQSGLDTIEMGRDIEHGAPLLGSLVGIAMESIGDTSLQDVPPHLNAVDAKNGARRLEKIIADGTAPADVLREEKWGVLTRARGGFSPTPNRWAGILATPFTAPIGPMMDKNIAEIQKPYPLQTTPPIPSGLFSNYAALLYSSPKRLGFSFARRETLESSLLLRLALRAYRLENGAYPDQLAQLAPQYLAKIPRDAFGRGEAMRYRKTSDSYLVWSIGPDGKDNGGTPIPIKSGKKRVIVDQKSLGDAVARP